jgi:hypothetical protein
MINADIASYVNFFKQFADSNPSVKFFLYGSIEKGIEYARGFDTFDYPFLWLEQPSIAILDNGYGSHTAEYLSGISVLIQAPLDDNDAQIEASNNAYTIMLDLLKYIKHSQNDGLIICDLAGSRIEAVSQLWSDANFGWRLEFRPILNINKYLC